MKNIITLIALIVILTAAAFPASDDGARGELKVGFAQVDITPPAGAIITGPAGPISTGASHSTF
jgi:hypothetical protein